MFELTRDFNIDLVGTIPIWNKNLGLSVSLDQAFLDKRDWPVPAIVWTRKKVPALSHNLLNGQSKIISYHFLFLLFMNFSRNVYNLGRLTPFGLPSYPSGNRDWLVVPVGLHSKWCNSFHLNDLRIWTRRMYWCLSCFWWTAVVSRIGFWIRQDKWHVHRNAVNLCLMDYCLVLHYTLRDVR